MMMTTTKMMEDSRSVSLMIIKNKQTNNNEQRGKQTVKLCSNESHSGLRHCLCKYLVLDCNAPKAHLRYQNNQNYLTGNSRGGGRYLTG